MNNFIEQSAYFGVFITFGTYWLGSMCKKKWNYALINPLLISIALILIFLVTFHIDYATYNLSAKYISYLLTPATICLALPLYEQFETLKKNWKALLLGITSGVLSSTLSVLGICMLFKLSHEEYIAFLPKSITTAIGMGLSEEMGGIVPITVAAIVLTGLFGNIFAEMILKLFRIEEPIAQGIGIGSASHAMGTAKAMTMGDVTGAMSSLSIVVSGLLTVIAANIFSGLM